MQETARKFAREVIIPKATEYDRSGEVCTYIRGGGVCTVACVCVCVCVLCSVSVGGDKAGLGHWLDERRRAY